uniref:RxLR effector protein n=1 Tax=Globisporangium ultimum (strain ATCC 200006 / CBS 805.95 / DAOM BR144) TaxID=431595 RepID=K3X4H4_GLOUD
MKLATILFALVAVAASVSASEEASGSTLGISEAVGIPEVIENDSDSAVQSTMLGVPVHTMSPNAADSHSALGVPVAISKDSPLVKELVKLGIPISIEQEGLNDDASSSSGSGSSEEITFPSKHHHKHQHKKHVRGSSGWTPGSKQGKAGEATVHIYGQPDKVIDVATPAPTTFATPAPTVPTPAPTFFSTPAPTVPTPAPTFFSTPAPTVPTPAPTYTTPAPTVPTPAPTDFEASPSGANPDSVNPYIKQVELPTETPMVTLATDSPATDGSTTSTPLHDSEAVTTALSASASDTEDEKTSIAVPMAVAGCVAAALAVAVVALIKQKRARSNSTITALPTSGAEVDYNNQMVTPV